MAEIFLSYFAIVGMMFMIIYFSDLIFYRKFNTKMVLTFDTRKLSVEECIDALELIHSVRQFASGKAAISELNILVRDNDEEKERVIKEFLRVFNIPGEIKILECESNVTLLS